MKYVDESLRQIDEEKTKLLNLAEDIRKVVDNSDEQSRREAQNKIAAWMRRVEELTHMSIRLEAIKEQLAGVSGAESLDSMAELLEKWNDPEWRRSMGAWNARMNEAASRIREQFSQPYQFDDGAVGPIFMGGPLE